MRLEVAHHSLPITHYMSARAVCSLTIGKKLPCHGSSHGVAGFRLYVSPVAIESSMATGATQALKYLELRLPWGRLRGRKVIGSSTEVHVVDALAITGEEGRGSLRKAAGSWQTSIDPQMSEWGNPLRKEYPFLNT